MENKWEWETFACLEARLDWIITDGHACANRVSIVYSFTITQERTSGLLPPRHRLSDRHGASAEGKGKLLLSVALKINSVALLWTQSVVQVVK